MIRRTLLLISVTGSLWAQVSFDRLLNTNKEPQNWLTYSGTIMSQRYSALTQITPENVKNLELQWVYQARSLEKFEATPLVVDGVMYTVQNPDDVVALDPVTGRIFWTFSWTPSPDSRPCCGRLSRGVAILGDIDAYDVATGKHVWRFYTIPGAGEKGNETWAGDSWKTGGASVWVTGSYDPDLNLTYWGIGNPGPDWNPAQRPGDNFYSDSVVALDADTGALK